MATITRHASDETRRPREVLSLRTWRGRNCSNRSEHSDNTETDEATQLFAAFLRTVNRWDIDRRRGKGGLFASYRRWDKRDAERAWKAYFGKTREVVR